MNQLYPIIRRARRPLLPPDEPAPPQMPQPTVQMADVPDETAATNQQPKADAPEPTQQNP